MTSQQQIRRGGRSNRQQRCSKAGCLPCVTWRALLKPPRTRGWCWNPRLIGRRGYALPRRIRIQTPLPGLFHRIHRLGTRRGTGETPLRCGKTRSRATATAQRQRFSFLPYGRRFHPSACGHRPSPIQISPSCCLPPALSLLLLVAGIIIARKRHPRTLGTRSRRPVHRATPPIHRDVLHAPRRTSHVILKADTADSRMLRNGSESWIYKGRHLLRHARQWCGSGTWISGTGGARTDIDLRNSSVGRCERDRAAATGAATSKEAGRSVGACDGRL